MDGSFHSPEWHAARLASLNTSHTVTWEEFKRKQKVILLQAKEHIFLKTESEVCMWTVLSSLNNISHN